ncbi:MAG: hypothetical protein U0894_02035 [Pirellulales bacterium]
METSPLNEQKYAWVTSNLGPPTREFITPVLGDIISAQAVLRGGLAGTGATAPFCLLRTSMPPLGRVSTEGNFEDVPVFEVDTGILRRMA